MIMCGESSSSTFDDDDRLESILQRRAIATISNDVHRISVNMQLHLATAASSQSTKRRLDLKSQWRGAVDADQRDAKHAIRVAYQRHPHHINKMLNKNKQAATTVCLVVVVSGSVVAGALLLLQPLLLLLLQLHQLPYLIALYIQQLLMCSYSWWHL